MQNLQNTIEFHIALYQNPNTFKTSFSELKDSELSDISKVITFPKTHVLHKTIYSKKPGCSELFKYIHEPLAQWSMVYQKV